MCEIAGRTAYKSEDRITEGSAKKFVEALMKLKSPMIDLSKKDSFGDEYKEIPRSGFLR